MAAAMAATLRTRVSSMMKGPKAALDAAAAASRSPDSIVTVTCTMNNVHVCVADIDSKVLVKLSGGNLGLKHRQRATPDAALSLGTQAAQKAYEAGYRVCHLRFKGPSSGRSGVLRGIQAGGVAIADIEDITRLPTNGCRPKSARRL